MERISYRSRKTSAIFSSELKSRPDGAPGREHRRIAPLSRRAPRPASPVPFTMRAMLARGFRFAVSAGALAGPLLLVLPAIAEESLEVKSGETVFLDGTVHYTT